MKKISPEINQIIPLKAIVFTGLFFSVYLIYKPVKAQIIPDNSLGAERSLVVPDVQINGINSDRIEGGAVRDSNLFHSFEDFNINEGRGAYFANPASITNIFTRVTGVNPSSILGTLGVLGNANLYLINPNGIFFGPDARLDLRGSLFATTASALIFPDGSEYNARNPAAPPLLTVNVPQPVGLRFQGQEGIITNAADLTVSSGQTLSLSGSRVTMTGNITAPGGRVEILGTESIALLENAMVDVSAPDGGGTVLIGGDFQGGQSQVPNAKRTYIDSNVFINADALINGNGGRVVIRADEVTGFYGTISVRGGIRLGNGGQVEISGKEHLLFRGIVSAGASKGLPGTLLLDAKDIVIADGSTDQEEETDTFAGNNPDLAASILTMPLAEIDDTPPTTIYEFELEDLPSNIILQASNNITLQNLTDDRLDLAPSLGVIIFKADADGNGRGDFVMDDIADIMFTAGRNITISGANLAIGNIITTSPVLNSGSIDLNATNNVKITGLVNNSIFKGEAGAINATGKSVVITDGGQINSSVLNSGDEVEARAINVMGKSVIVQDGTRRSFFVPGMGNYSGVNNGGAINIKARESIEISGEARPNLRSAIGSLVDKGAIGNAGDINIETRSLHIKNGASIVTSTLGDGNTGAISIIAADSIELSGGSSKGAESLIQSLVDREANGNSAGITLNTRILSLKDGALIGTGVEGTGNSGAISITATHAITLEGESNQNFGSRIATSILARGRGTGGTITIDTRFLSVKDGGFIAASTAGTGNGGTVSITAADAITLEGGHSEASVSSIANQVIVGGKGNAGEITINTDFLSLKGEASISTSSRGEGDAGSIVINARNGVTLQGSNREGRKGLYSQVHPSAVGNAGGITINTPSLSLVDGAVVSVETAGKGNGGNISISAWTLELNNGSVFSTNTATDFNAGNITLNIRDSFIATGNNTGVFADTTVNAIGNGGNILINSGQIILSEGATVSVDNLGRGIGGNIDIYSKDLNLNNATITGQTSSNRGGNISINIDNILRLRNNSQISATAGTAGAGGDGGNINIDSRFILAVPSENSDISANAFLGKGGNILINSEAILGIEFRETPTNYSDITASSQFGLAGIVAINSPTTDLNQGLAGLSEQVVNTEIIIGCDVAATSATAFYNLGRGGIEVSPDDLFSENLSDEWIGLNSRFDDLSSLQHGLDRQFIKINLAHCSSQKHE